ncbi:hypothetical protein E2C01_059337 [Portunus trituberculatus]|uniref:Uncharacterized protein n=1 Tax=Portunus trituberculatus TaxID=210409 RepID=A0A5B7H5K1_PORTR|nr:hypothetical protein [Portunus trituberculatus]
MRQPATDLPLILPASPAAVCCPSHLLLYSTSCSATDCCRQ